MPISSYLQSVAYIIDRPFFERPQFINSVTLPFTMQVQTQSNWCWAATATSVSLFYTSSSTWTQCTVANGELNLTDCCSRPS